MRPINRLLGATLAASFLMLPTGCAMGEGGLFGLDRHSNEFGTRGSEKREIPLSPGVPPLGQQPVLPRDAALDAGSVPLNIVYTNDIHSRVDPFPDNFYYSFYSAKGGFSRLTTAIRDQKAANPNTIAVDSGDYLQGTPYFNFFKGETEMKLMQAAGFDAITIGNHEFDNGVDDLKKVLPFYKGSLITTNMTFTPEVAQRYVVKKVGPVRVGMFALITEVNGLVAAPNFKGAQYYDPIKVAQAAVAKLKKECDVIVVLSHMGTKAPWESAEAQAMLEDDHPVDEAPITDEVLADKVPGIDVIISGHTHVMIKEPKIIRHGNQKTFIVSAGMGGGYLGKASLTLQKGAVTYLKNEAIPMTASVPNTPGIDQMISPYREVVNRTVKETIGTASGAFKRYGNKDTESSLNNLVADSTLAAARKVRPDVSFAVISSGTPRNNMSAGTIKVEDCFYALPFDNKIVIMEVDGKTAIDMLTIQRRPTDNKRHAISNATYTLTANNGPISDVMIAGKPVDPKAKYVVAVNDYMADGSSGFTMLPGNPRINTNILQRDALIEFVRVNKNIAPQTGRIKAPAAKAR